MAGPDIGKDRRFATDIEMRTDLVLQHISDDVVLLSERTRPPIILDRGRGAILGALFPATGGGAHFEAMSAGAVAAIWGSRGGHLLSHYWGSYVAVLDDDDDRRLELLRAPCTGMPCYYVETAQRLVVSSDMMTMVLSGHLSPEVSRDILIDHLLRPTLRTERTLIRGLRELPAGARLTWRRGGPASTERLWNPWEIATRDPVIGDERLASELVRETVQQSVASWAGLSGRILLGVSGGLDSSILAACLAHCGAPFEIMTLVTKEAAGDERFFVHALANAFDVPLHEAFEKIELVDLRRSAAAHLPRPLARSFAQSGGAHTALIADEIGAKTIWSGGGGDNVFCFLQSTVQVADRLLVGGLGAGALATARDMARLTGASVPVVLGKAIHRAYWRAPAYRWPVERLYLSREALCRPLDEPGHPWLTVPAGRLPGEAGHIALILAIENFLEGWDEEDRLPRCFPLLSQPVVETCLRVRSWLWCSGGINRAVARRAFADRLPAVIIERTVKGTPSSFVMEILERNRLLVREMLEHGHLAAMGMLDLPAVREMLAQPGPIQGDDYSRILGLVDIEAWLGSLPSAGARAPGPDPRLSEARNASQ